MTQKIRIAIDGPAASGKSTTARLLAQKLGYLYIDTGAMYRAATLSVLRAGIDVHDEQAVVDHVRNIKISLKIVDGIQRTFLNDEDVSDQIRTPQINQIISVISSYPGVREVLIEQQRELAKEGGVVMDGRDIGTVVLPDAELKVFLVASIKERARRRQLDLERQGIKMDLKAIEQEIKQRDKLDSSRAQSPLKKADDARELDTTNLTIKEQVEIIYRWALEKIEKGAAK
ncbi:Cytidylate kinase [Caldithrix abyssi DSM 13497]|uniref:Cytidylate kinase n=1 Tax=Caldithrix abyssi DSM 13497 TaxID=880073 RepID=H1XYB7_CALAY|nr:cmk cytidylate kinase [Caldithrix abyssi DSM 13497]EHO43184.1 Cytidylate kinase [Caldithrix abyssi DSM 13497]